MIGRFAMRLVCFLQMRYAVASGGARVLERLSDYESREAVSEGSEVMPRGLRVAATCVRRARPARWRQRRDAWQRSPGCAAAGHADAIATLMRRALTRTRAPLSSSLRRMVPQVALANFGWTWSGPLPRPRPQPFALNFRCKRQLCPPEVRRPQRVYLQLTSWSRASTK